MAAVVLPSGQVVSYLAFKEMQARGATGVTKYNARALPDNMDKGADFSSDVLRGLAAAMLTARKAPATMMLGGKTLLGTPASLGVRAQLGP